VVKQLTDAGYEAYLVGGCVRDLLLQHKPKDFDVATSAFPEEVRSLFDRSRLIGRRFRLAHVRMGREIVEVATFRAGMVADPEDEEHRHVNAQGRILRDNVYGCMEEDAFRRDFTINALYYDPITEDVVDYVHGVAHLRAGRLITIGDADLRFREDPVRMLRAIRFSVKLGLTLDDDLKTAIARSADTLNQVPPSRMLDEMLKLFHNGYGLDVFRALRSTGLFTHLFPFTEQCIVDDDYNLPVLALKNTDTRVGEGKPVISAFLFACFLWNPLRAAVEKLTANGVSPREAYATSADDLLRDQSMYVALPRRIGVVVHEIWSLQKRLEKRLPRGVTPLLRHKRFRAAYDFLLLRQAMGEVDVELTDWWTQIQESDQNQQQDMIKTLQPPAQRGRRRRRRRAR